jgi:hypothetical protein
MIDLNGRHTVLLMIIDLSPPPTVGIEASDRDLSTSQHTHDNTTSHRDLL